jgi:uncharacterized protein with NAD-binding domain and iron-sulfur cluster
MINPNIITDLFRYFAKFPLKQGMIKNFANGASSFSEWLTLKAEMDSLVTHSIIPQLTDFIFGFDSSITAERVKNIKSHFLYVEYGIMDLNRNQFEVFNNQINIKIAVGHPFSHKNKDSIEEVILQDRNLNYLLQIISYINDEDIDRCSIKRYLSYPVKFVPFDPITMYENIGWFAVFNSNNNDIL